MPKFFGTAFAVSGDRTTLPTDKQPDGAMSYQEGWTYDYERHPINDEKAKHIERGKMNYLFFIITEAIGELQRQGAMTWDETVGSYPLGVTCFYQGATWLSAKSVNKDKPGLTDAWLDISKFKGSGSGGEIDPDKFVTKEGLSTQLAQVNEDISNITPHLNGDIYNVSRTAVTEHEYVCDGTVVPIKSNLGILLSSFDENFRNGWHITTIGETQITLPWLLNDQHSNIALPLYTYTPGDDRSGPANILGLIAADADLPVGTTAIPMNIVGWIPTIYLNTKDITPSEKMEVFFEGIGDRSNVVRQLVFSLYSGGERFGDPTVPYTGTVSSLIFYDQDDKVVPSEQAGTSISNTDTETTFKITLKNPISQAKTITCTGFYSYPDPESGEIKKIPFSIIKEPFFKDYKDLT